MPPFRFSPADKPRSFAASAAVLAFCFMSPGAWAGDVAQTWPHIPKSRAAMAPEACISEQEKLISAGKTREALRLLNLCLRERPDVVALYYYRAKLYMQLKDYRSAILDCSRQVKLEPQLSNPYEMRARCYLALKDIPAAKRDLLHAIELEPANKAAHRQLAGIYRTEGDFRKYKQELQLSRSNRLPGKNGVVPAVLTRHDHPVSAFLQNAGEHLAHKKPGLALDEIKKVMKLSDQDFAVEHFDRGEAFDLQAQAFQQMDLHDEAIAALDQVLKYQPNNNRVYYLKAQSYFAQGKYEECLSNCDRASRGDKILSNTVAELRAQAEERLKRRSQRR